MHHPKEDTTQLVETGKLVGLLNVLLAPVYYANSKWGVTASIAATGATLYLCKKIGEEQRIQESEVESTSVAHIGGFFSGTTAEKKQPKEAIEQTFGDVIAGGSALYNSLMSGASV